MRKITLQRVDLPIDTAANPLYGQTYGMRLTVTAAYDMPTQVFVKQRIAADGSQDIMAAVASAEQLESLPINEPGPDTSYFRTSSVELRAVNSARLDEIRGG